jgi:xanthine dehydrogenase accessory factor
MTPTLLAALLTARAAKKPVVVATRLEDGAQALVAEDGRHGAALPEAVAARALAALAEDRS